jgi:chemotaxis protein CheZ
MNTGTLAKPFTAEIQRLKKMSPSAAAKLDQEPSNWKASEILDAVAALRQDVKELQYLLATSENVDESVRNRLNEEKAALQNERAEVDLLRTEVRALGRCIQQTKAEISALRPASAGGDHILSVTNELDAVVESTEGATEAILGCSENIENILQSLLAHAPDNHVRNMADQISDQVIKIYEACNFQDITGQRITKVVNTLNFIETRISAMIDIWGEESISSLDPAAEMEKAHKEDHLVSGPQLPSRAISQDDIDKLFG